MEELVLEELRELLRFVSRHEKRFVRLVMDKSAQDHKRETAAKKKALAKHRQRIAEIDTLIERLYVDNVSGKVTDERYEKMSAKVSIFRAYGHSITSAILSDYYDNRDDCHIHII